MTARPFVTALLTGLLAVSLAAQTPAPPTQNPPVFTSAVDVARLDVRVTDRAGKPITDLRPDEVQVVEGGTARPVVLLQHVAEAGRTYAESAQRTIAAEVSTNQGAPRGELYLLLFDQDHITAGAEQKVRLAAERFVKERVRPQDRIAVVGIPGPGPSLTFTNNTRNAIEQLQLVRGGLNRLQTGVAGEMTEFEAYEILRGNELVLSRFLYPSAEGTTTRASALIDAIAGARQKQESPETLRRLVQDSARTTATKADADSRRFLQIAVDLLRSFRHIDGRKTIVLFSEGFVGDSLNSELRDLAAAAAEIYGVVYAFDLNARMDATGSEPMGGDTAKEIQSRTDTIGSLAAETSGALIPDALSRLDQALGALGAPNNDYYIVGFESSASALANRNAYQRVEVKVTRPGAVVTTRTGYTAGTDARAENTLSSIRRLTIDSALTAPFGHQGLRVDYTTYQSHGAGTASERIVLSLEAELPINVAKTSAATGASAAKADAVFVVRDARTGRVAASGSDEMALPTSVARGRTTGVGAWRVQFMLPPGDYIMRAIVREPGGLIGSADRQFNVRALGGPDVSPSDLILGRPGPALPVRAAAYTAEPLPAAVRVYGRTSAQLDKMTARIELLPVGGTTAVVGVSGIAGDTHEADGQSVRDVMFESPLATVPAGDYVARAEIRSGGEFVSELRRQVTVSVGANPVPATDAARDEAPVPSAAADGLVATALLTDAAASTSPAVRQAVGGVASLRAGHYPEAVTALNAAFEASGGKSAPIAFLLGWAERGAGNLVGGVSAFRNAALLDPSMISAHLALADTYMELKQPALAIQALESGLRSQPNAVELKRMLEIIRK